MLTSREFPPPCDPCDPRPCSHRRIRRGRRVGRCRGAASQEADGITAHDGGRRNRGRHGAAGGVGDLLLARVLGLGVAHFPLHPLLVSRPAHGDSFVGAPASYLVRGRIFDPLKASLKRRLLNVTFRCLPAPVRTSTASWERGQHTLSPWIGSY